MDCRDEVATFQTYIAISLFLTVVVFIYSNKNNQFADSPTRGIKFFYVCGGIKLLIGILLASVLYPKDCGGFHNAYPVVAMGIGCFWLFRGYRLQRTRDSVGTPIGGGAMEMA